MPEDPQPVAVAPSLPASPAVAEPGAASNFEHACLAIMGLCALGAAAMGVYGWLEVPGGTSVVTTFDMAGRPSGWSVAPGAFATGVFFSLLPPLLTWGVPKLKPSTSALERNFVAGVNAAIAPVLVFGQWSIVAYAVRTVGAG